MNTNKTWALALLVILVGAVSFFAYSYYEQRSQGLLEASGTMEATTVEISPRLNGTIEKLAVQEGQKVKAGEVLAVLSRNDLMVQRDRDALGVAVAQARYNDLLSGFRAEEITEATANLSLAQANLEQATVDLNRIERLFAEGAVAQDKLETAQLNRTTRLKQVDAAQARLGLLESGNRPEVLAGAEAEFKRSQAILKTTEVMLEDLEIRSPLDGTVSSRNFEAGEYVPMGASLLSITDLDHLWINVYIPAADLPRVKLNQPAEITISGSKQPFSGTVSYIASQGEFTPKTIQTKKERANVVFAVRILVDDQEHILKPGMPADVTFSGS